MVVPSARAEKEGDNVEISLKEPRQRKGKKNVPREEEVRADLGARVKQFLQSKLSQLEREEADFSPSAVRKVLDISVDETSVLDPTVRTVSRSGSFLDRLISEMKSARESESDDLDFDHEFELENEDQEIEKDENLEGLLFFQDYDDYDLDKQDSESRDSNIFGNFLEEEEDAVEEETRNIAEEIQDLLQELEENDDFEEKLMDKAEQIIKSKLRNLPLRRLIRVKISIIKIPFLSDNSGQRLH